MWWMKFNEWGVEWAHHLSSCEATRTIESDGGERGKTSRRAGSLIQKLHSQNSHRVPPSPRRIVIVLSIGRVFSPLFLSWFHHSHQLTPCEDGQVRQANEMVSRGPIQTASRCSHSLRCRCSSLSRLSHLCNLHFSLRSWKIGWMDDARLSSSQDVSLPCTLSSSSLLLLDPFLHFLTSSESGSHKDSLCYWLSTFTFLPDSSWFMWVWIEGKGGK